ncbi:CDP-glycerol glycerophosphotransferase family protein [Candidatus Neomarinimicrobiota bacterium]
MKIFFHAHHLYYLPQFLPVANALAKQHKISFGYPSRATAREVEILVSEISSNGWPVYLSSEAQAQAKNSDVLILGSSSDVESLAGPKTLAVLLFHSIGLKRIYYTDYHPRINLRFIESDYHRNRCLEFTPDLDIRTVGFAKLDPLYNNTLTTIEYLPDGDGPSILYAPTFYPGSLEILGHLIHSWPPNWQVLIKPHQFTLTNPFYRYQRVLLEDLAQQCSNVTVLPLDAYSILPAYQWADVLVSEISSTIIEFSVMDKPIVVCDQLHLRLHHRQRRSRYLEQRVDSELLGLLDFAHHSASAAGVADTISYAIDHPDELTSKRKRGRETLVGQYDGQTSERIVEIIENALL